MPSDLAPISTTTWVAVSFSTVPLMTWSSLAASSASVVKLSRAEAKSSVGRACSSAESAVRHGQTGCGSGECCLGRAGSGFSVDNGWRSKTRNPGCGRLFRRARLMASLGFSRTRVRGRCGRLADGWRESKVVLGPPWRTDWNNPSGRTSLRKPASKGNSSTIATASEQCQTQIPRMLQQRFNSRETV